MNLKNIFILGIIFATAIGFIAPIASAETLVSGKNRQAYDNLVFDKKNTIGITYSKNELMLITLLIENNKLNEARKRIYPLLKWLEESTEYHTTLYKTLIKVDKAKAQSDIERNLAVQSAMLRDKTMYQLSLLHLKNDNKKDAVKILVNIVKSQPRSELGFQAYEQLQKCGFTYKIEPSDTKPVEHKEL